MMFGEIVMAVVIGGATAAGYYIYLRRSGTIPAGGQARYLVMIGGITAVLAFGLLQLF